MSTVLDWAVAYEETQRTTAANLRLAREQGRVCYVFGDGGPCNLAPVDPRRLDDHKIGETARLHAERVVQRGINQQAQQCR